VRQGVTKVAGRITNLANGVMSSLQEKYGYWKLLITIFKSQKKFMNSIISNHKTQVNAIWFNPKLNHKWVLLFINSLVSSIGVSGNYTSALRKLEKP
jgi:hypothetical protein